MSDLHISNHKVTAGNDSWRADLTPHKLSHSSIWAYLAQGLTLLGNLCGLSALIKDISTALQQVRAGHAETHA